MFSNNVPGNSRTTLNALQTDERGIICFARGRHHFAQISNDNHIGIHAQIWKAAIECVRMMGRMAIFPVIINGISFCREHAEEIHISPPHWLCLYTGCPQRLFWKSSHLSAWRWVCFLGKYRFVYSCISVYQWLLAQNMRSFGVFVERTRSQGIFCGMCSAKTVARVKLCELKQIEVFVSVYQWLFQKRVDYAHGFIPLWGWMH